MKRTELAPKLQIFKCVNLRIIVFYAVFFSVSGEKGLQSYENPEYDKRPVTGDSRVFLVAKNILIEFLILLL